MFQSVAKAECRLYDRHFLTLLVGFSLGFCIAYIYFTSLGYQYYHKYPMSDSLETRHALEIINHDRNSSAAHKGEDRTVADQLFQQVRVLCWVMTHPFNHRRKAAHVKATWGSRCNKVLFMSSEEDDTLPTVKLPVEEGRENLWAKTKEAFRYVYEHHRRDADWFLKADDDTYVIVENLRYMLADYDPSDPLYFGCRFKGYARQGFMSGGAGYVISKEALARFVNKELPTPNFCYTGNEGYEDVEMGICLEHLGVKAMDSRDASGRGRFFPFLPVDHLFPGRDPTFWYWKYIYYQTDEGLDCCSDFGITFHYMSPKELYVMDYLIYHLRPFGIKYGGGDVIPQKVINL